MLAVALAVLVVVVVVVVLLLGSCVDSVTTSVAGAPSVCALVSVAVLARLVVLSVAVEELVVAVWEATFAVVASCACFETAPWR